MKDLITIVLPVYGSSPFLSEALSSVYMQDDPDWRLLIADDGSAESAARLIDQQSVDPRVSVVRWPKNLGLFGNLNASLRMLKTSWHLILCSDDRLEPHAIRYLKRSITLNPDVRLILSSYQSIDSYGHLRHDVNGSFYDLFAPHSRLFSPFTLLEPLLQFGSINGNITGLLIENTLFQDSGLWRTDWSQAADWEWLVRSCTHTSVLVRREPIAQVRVHEGQLSVRNRKLQIEASETLQVLSLLLSHPYLQNFRSRRRWAAHHAQFMLWNAIKAMPKVGFRATMHQLFLIQYHVGLPITAFAFLSTLPRRLRIRGTEAPLLPPH